MTLTKKLVQKASKDGEEEDEFRVSISCICLKSAQEGIPCEHELAVCAKILDFRKDLDWVTSLIKERWISKT